MASKWERFKAIFSPAMRERLNDRALDAYEDQQRDWDEQELAARAGRPDPEVIAEQNYIERGAAMMEDDGIARHERKLEKSDYDRRLDEIAEQAKYRVKDDERGIDR